MKSSFPTKRSNFLSKKSLSAIVEWTLSSGSDCLRTKSTRHVIHLNYKERIIHGPAEIWNLSSSVHIDIERVRYRM